MKLQALLIQAAFSAAVAMTGTAFAAGEHEHKPMHGGLVVETKQLDHELLAKPGVIQLYLRGHDGKPADIAKASARLTLLAGTEKQEVELKPAGDKLEATGNFKVGAGTKVVSVVSGASKSVSTARFTLK